MTTMTKKVSPRDRWADWVVVGVVIVALLLGWALKVSAENKTLSYSNEGVTVHYPYGWLLDDKSGYIVKVSDPNSGLFRTTYIVQTGAIDAGVSETAALISLLNNVSLSRAQTTTAYKLFQVEEVQVRGKPAVKATYVYVEEKPNPFRETVPVVVEGVDYAFAEGGKVYVFTLLAAEPDFAAAEQHFAAFLESAEIR
jgi:hypothetical protein